LVVRHCSRLERAEQLETARARLAAGQPQRQVAADLGLARSTLQQWCKPVAVGAAPAALVAWLETPEGVRCLHQGVLAAHFSITLQGASGIRVVCQFLELSGLSAFVGASYGTQQGLNAALEEALVAVADEQRAALARGMPHRDLTVCEEETFPPQICWVALEPVSGFLVLEQYAADRQAATWTQALQEALVGLDVAVIQGTSTGGQRLRRMLPAQQLRGAGPQRSTGPASPGSPSPERPQARGAHRRTQLPHPSRRRPRPRRQPYLMPLAA
jgi:uncharacterized protein (UPF0548 family)